MLINGNFGYWDNLLVNINFIGDFEVEWLFNCLGDICLKVYNEMNDCYYMWINLII